MIFLHFRWNSLMLSACTLLSLAQRLQWKCETYTRIQANSEFAPQSQARSTFMKTTMDLTRSTPTKKKSNDFWQTNARILSHRLNSARVIVTKQNICWCGKWMYALLSKQLIWMVVNWQLAENASYLLADAGHLKLVTCRQSIKRLTVTMC